MVPKDILDSRLRSNGELLVDAERADVLNEINWLESYGGATLKNCLWVERLRGIAQGMREDKERVYVQFVRGSA